MHCVEIPSLVLEIEESVKSLKMSNQSPGGFQLRFNFRTSRTSCRDSGGGGSEVVAEAEAVRSDGVTIGVCATNEQVAVVTS